MRRTTRLKLNVNLVGLMLLISTCAVAEQPWCKYKEVQFKDQAPLPIAINELIVASIQNVSVGTNPAFASAIENSIGQATIVNKASRKIVSYLLLFELTMDDGERVSIPLFNFDTKRATTLQAELSSWVRAHGKHLGPVLPPGDPTEVDFSSLTMLTRCPKTVALSAVSVQYDDGEIFESKSNFVYLQPVILSAPLPESEAMGRWTAETATGALEVESDGHGEVVAVNSHNAEVTQFLQRAVRGWTFHPAVSQGMPMKGEIKFILSIGQLPTDWSKQRSTALASDGVLTAIHIVPPLRVPRRTRWMVEIGGSRF